MCDKNGTSRGREGGPFCELILENPEGMGGHRKNPFRWGGGGGVMDIFWNYTIPITVPQENEQTGNERCKCNGNLIICLFADLTPVLWAPRFLKE